MKSRKTEEHSLSSRRLIYAVAAIIIILVTTIFSLQFYFAGAGQGTPKAAIIDELGSSELDPAVRAENQTFLAAATELLYKRFSVVDYYSDNATVEQYKQLASEDYKLIIWRAHSAVDMNSGYVAISTTDESSSTNCDRYSEYLEDGLLTICNITGNSGESFYYLGITPKFIDQVMTGTFQDTVIVLMSCNGLNQDFLKTAQALEAKGAKAVISWDGWITPSDNDNGTSFLLQYLINENDSVGVAVSKISPSLSDEYGNLNGNPNTTLQYDPHTPQAANYQIPDYREQSSPQHDALMTVALRKTVEPQDNES